MKKIFTLLLAAGFVTVASAQSNGFKHANDDHGKQQTVYAFNDKHDDGYGKQQNVYAFNDRHNAIQDISRSYDFKIAAVQQNRWLNRYEKSRQISQLQRERDAAIAQATFHSNDHGFADSRKNRW